VHRVDDQGKVIEADLEEIYFYKIKPDNGFAYQRVYTDDRSIDAVMMAQHHDMVLVPAGYHPVVSAHGYTTYYLNFLAGSAQSLANVDDPALAWVKQTWKEQDPRLPLVSHDMEK
jgi:5-deoxy-glucuronate isomerase